ncbi:serine/threonine-protein kinase [Gordonia sp. LUNF6]|uniref:serine/threonine-protein kinase n=1 Tax=Gordonia TaxID=2053 RepID=UPI0024160016|nr:serine/threonine-protein kinase [Gordonia sihwensis]WFN94838.1 serine/threonine-protein kinase [Gordonia sihwensis]
MLSPGQYFANYLIERRLGVGGMGEVYLVAHPRLPREDALKVLPAELTGDPTYRARFIREADLASQLDHPGIVSVYDRGEFEGQLWIAMKYVPGADGDALLQQSGPLDRATVCEMIGAVADALDYAHSRGMLHRDVKPANILVDDSTAAHRKVYLTDFGIARTTTSDTALTAANLTVGSIQYCSPEQLRGAALDGRTDQYALACTAFRLLTGRAPFPLAKPTDIINAHLHAPAPSATAVLPTLAPAVDLVLARAMDKDPARRYRTCREFADELDGALRRPGFTPQAATPQAPAAYAPTMINPAPTPPHSGAQPTAPLAPQSPPAQQGPSPAQPYPQRPRIGAFGPPPVPQSPVPQPPIQQPPAQQPPHFGPPPGDFGRQQPYGAPGYPPEPTDTGRRKAVIVAAIVLVVLAAIAVAGFFVFRGDDGPDTAAGTSTVPSTPESTSSPVSTSAPSTTAGGPAVVAGVPTLCAGGVTTQSSSASRVGTGPISIPSNDLPVSGWDPDNISQIPFAVTANGIKASRPAGTSGWMAQIAVGTLPASFRDRTEPIARKLVECLSSSSGYSGVDASPARIEDVRNDRLDNKITEYTLIRARIDVRNQRSGVLGDDVTVVVVNSSPMTFAFGVSPINDATTRAEVDKAIVNLRVQTGN